MERDAEQTPPLVAAPRHLRRRRFRADIPDRLLVPDAKPFPVARARKPARQAGLASVGLRSYGRKRVAALLAVVVVSLTIPVLLFLLIFAA